MFKFAGALAGLGTQAGKEHLEHARRCQLRLCADMDIIDHLLVYDIQAVYIRCRLQMAAAYIAMDGHAGGRGRLTPCSTEQARLYGHVLFAQLTTRAVSQESRKET